MGIESATTIAGLNAAWPLGTDPKSEGDDHLRLIKRVMQADAARLSENNVFIGTKPVWARGSTSLLLSGTASPGSLETWAVGVNSLGSLSIVPRDGNGEVITDAGGLTLTRYTSGLSDVSFVGPSVSSTVPAASSVLTRARGDGRYALSSSSRRYKEAIDYDPSWPGIDDLAPAGWIWGGELAEDDPRRGAVGRGLIAEDLLATLPEAVVFNADGDVEGLNPLAVIGLLVHELQALRARVAQLEAAG